MTNCAVIKLCPLSVLTSVFMLGVRSGAFPLRRSTIKPSVRNSPGPSTWQMKTLNFKSQFVVLTMIHSFFFFLIGYLVFFSLTEFCSMARPDKEFQKVWTEKQWQHGKTRWGHNEVAGGCVVGSLNIWSEIGHKDWTLPATEHQDSLSKTPGRPLHHCLTLPPPLGQNLTMPELWTLWSYSYCIQQKTKCFVSFYFLCSLALYFSLPMYY